MGVDGVGNEGGGVCVSEGGNESRGGRGLFWWRRLVVVVAGQ